MKRNYANLPITLCLSAFILMFSSCVDESINMDRLSTDMLIGGNVAAPLGEMNVSINDLIGDLEFNQSAKVTIGERDGILNLFFSDTLDYTNPANIDFSSFGAIHKRLEPGTTLGLPSGFDLPGEVTYTIIETYDFNKINANLDSQRVDSVRFFNTTISATISTNLPAGFARVEIDLPVEFEGQKPEVVKLDLNDPSGSNSKDFTIQNFVCKADGQNNTTFPIRVILHGNGTQDLLPTHFIDINISLKQPEFVAYGYFNYGEDILLKDESLAMDLYNYLPDGNLLFPSNPEIKFKLATNIGVPVKFNLKELKTFNNDTTPVQIKDATFDGNVAKTFDINGATTYGQTATTELTFNKDVDKGKINELFTIKVDSAASKFSFGIKTTPNTTANQFVSSDSKLKITMDANLPLWLDEGSKLSFSDTIMLDEETIEAITDDAIKEAVIRVKYTNKLPMGVKSYIRMLDKDTISVVGSKLYTYDIKAAPVDATGATISQYDGFIEMRFNRADMDLLRNTKFLKMTFTGDAFSISSKMKFRMIDSIYVKVSAYGVAEKK